MIGTVNEGRDNLERALSAIRDIADLLGVLSEARDIDVPAREVAVLATALEAEHARAGAFERICPRDQR